MGGGLLVMGAAGYGFIALAGHTLSTADAAAVSSLYLLNNIIGPGIFSALEQETSRTLAAGAGLAAVRRRAVVAGGILLAVLLAALGVAGPALTRTALGGQWALFAALVAGTATSAAVYLVRGLLGGCRRFGGYAGTLAVEGLARILPCVAIALAGMPSAAAYGMVFAAGSAVAALAGLAALGTAEPDDGGSAQSMTRATAVLAGSTALSQLVANLAPVVVAARLVADTATAAAFAAAFVLVRVPLFVFSPVQAMLLPTLTAAVTRGDTTAVRRALRLILTAVGLVGSAGVLLSVTVGPWATEVFFGAHVRLPRLLLGALGVGTLALMAAQVLQPALVALRRHRAATAAWALGSAVLTGLLFLPGDTLTAAVLGQILGSALVVCGMAGALVAGLRRIGADRP